MIAIILGIVTALLQASFLAPLAPTGWQILLSVVVVIYLYRFGLRRLSHASAWCIGLGLDLMSSWRFGTWILLLLVVDLAADWALPSRSSGNAESVGHLLVFGSSTLITAAINLSNHQTWFLPALGSAVLSTLLYYVATRATIAWRIYE
jgi:hypothetical protein